jgi:iron complex outermembrane receptor protein
MSVINYEAGWKGQFFDRRLRTQLDVYYQTFDGYQAQFGFPTPAGLPPGINNLVEFRQAQTTSRIYGVEFGAQAHFDDLEWNVGVAYNKSRLGNFGVVQNPFFGTLGQTNATVDLNGAETPFAPHWTGNFGVAYTFHVDGLGSGTTLTPRVDLLYHSESFANLYHNRATLLPAETLVNAGLRLDHGPWWVQLWGTNLTDRRYPGAKQNVSGATGQILGIVYQAPPRLFGIRIGSSF